MSLKMMIIIEESFIFEQNCLELSWIIHPVICWLLESWPGGRVRGGQGGIFCYDEIPRLPVSSVVQER